MKGKHTYSGREFEWEVKDLRSKDGTVTNSAVLRVPENWLTLAQFVGPDGKIVQALAGVVPPEIVGYDEAYVSSLKRLILKNPRLRGTGSVEAKPRCKAHSWVNTGMTWTYCRHCEQQAKFAYGSIELLDRR